MIQDRWLQIDRIFQAALEQDPCERPSFLDDACAGDQGLRTEVGRLLNYDEQQQCLIDTSIIEVAAGLFGAAQHELAEGDQIAHYTIISLLGRGGMGEVYLARDSRLGRRVALKLLPADFIGNELWLRRFHQEARTASALNHPNIITIYEIGESDGRHFIATEFVDGETLRQRMRNRKLDLGETLDMAVKVAEALSAAHQAGIVHRDIKPENMMLRLDGAVKVLDFGLAKMAGTPQPSMALPTRAAAFDTAAPFDSIPGMVMGTAAYASPEQSRGEEVDAATDVYSLGIVILESLTGRSPVQRETAARQADEGEPATCNLQPATYPGDIPKEIKRVVNKAISRNRQQRYQTAKDLLVDLNKAVNGLEATKELAKSPRPTERLVGRISRTTRRSVALATAAVAALVGVAILATMALRAKHNDSAPFTSLAVLPFVNEQQDSNLDYLTDGMTEGLIRSLSQISSLRVISRASAFKFKGKESDPIAAGRELNVQAVLTGRVRQTGDRLSIYTALVRVEDGSQLLTEQYERGIGDALELQEQVSATIARRLRLQLSGEDARRVSNKGTTSADAYQLYMKGQYFLRKATVDGRRKAVDFFEQATAIDPNYALAYAGLAGCYGWQLHNIPQSQIGEVSSKAESAASKALALDDSLAEAHASLAYVKVTQWDWAGAEREYKRALELASDDAFTHDLYGMYLFFMHKYDESLVQMRKAQELNPISLMITARLGTVLFAAGHPDEAAKELGKVLEMDPNFMYAHYRMGMVYVEKGLFNQAIAETQRALSLSGEDPEIFAQLGAIYAMCGRRRQALAILEKVKDLNRRDGSLGVAIATIYAVLNDKEESLRWLNAAYEAHDPALEDINAGESYWDGLQSDPRFKDLLHRMGFVLTDNPAGNAPSQPD